MKTLKLIVQTKILTNKTSANVRDSWLGIRHEHTFIFGSKQTAVIFSLPNRTSHLMLKKQPATSINTHTYLPWFSPNNAASPTHSPNSIQL